CCCLAAIIVRNRGQNPQPISHACGAARDCDRLAADRSTPGSVSRGFSMKHYAFLLAGLLCVAPAFGEEATLKTVVDGTFAPHAMPKLGGGYEGFNIDLANEIAKRLKRKSVIDTTQFSGIVPALMAGTYDYVAAPTTVTKERADN